MNDLLGLAAAVSPEARVRSSHNLRGTPGRAPPTPAKTAVTLRISLNGHTPTIWRRLLVPGEIGLSTLHLILQVAMGWQNCHLDVFEIAGQRHGVAGLESDVDDIDEDAVALLEVVEVVGEGGRFLYEYDFGDSWRHEIVVESIESATPALRHAVCLEGQRACPPEDCGGVRAYSYMLEALADTDHQDFDPEAFDLAAINATLQWVR